MERELLHELTLTIFLVETGPKKLLVRSELNFQTEEMWPVLSLTELPLDAYLPTFTLGALPCISALILPLVGR